MNAPSAKSQQARWTVFIVVGLFLAINAALIYKVLEKPKASPPAPNQVASTVTAPQPSVESAPTIRGRVTYKGTPPPEIEVQITDSACAKLHGGGRLLTRNHRVGTNSGFGDVFVHLKSGLANRDFAPPAQPVVMRQMGCIYVDYVVGAQTGQRIVIKNLDPILHNIHFTPQNRRNQESNKAQMAGGPDVEFVADAPDLPIRLKCDVHPWELAYIYCVDHPFFAVSDGDGRYEFPQTLPPGKYVIEAIHRKAGSQTKEIELAANGGARVDFEFKQP